jgi:hypothetical protein
LIPIHAIYVLSLPCFVWAHARGGTALARSGTPRLGSDGVDMQGGGWPNAPTAVVAVHIFDVPRLVGRRDVGRRGVSGISTSNVVGGSRFSVASLVLLIVAWWSQRL